MRSFGYCLLAAGVAAMIGGAARADQLTSLPGGDDAGLVVGIGVICNTTQQAEAYVQLRGSGAKLQPAIAQINQKVGDPKACGLAAIAFQRDRTIETKTVQNKLVSIVRVNVVGGFNGQQWTRVPAMIRYVVMEAEGVAI